jgi:hypothetical protein
MKLIANQFHPDLFWAGYLLDAGFYAETGFRLCYNQLLDKLVKDNE